MKNPKKVKGKGKKKAKAPSTQVRNHASWQQADADACAMKCKCADLLQANQAMQRLAKLIGGVHYDKLVSYGDALCCMCTGCQHNTADGH